MGFLKKLFGNVEKANKGEIPVEEIVPPLQMIYLKKQMIIGDKRKSFS